MDMKVLKRLLPDHPVPTRILRGPFRGACIVMNPRDSLRKILGFYEHELNPWLEQALRRVTRVLDVGANDGYFTFGCAAAFRRRGKAGEIVAFEPQDQHILKLRESLKHLNGNQTRITVIQRFVGQTEAPNTTTLETIQWKTGTPNDRRNTLVKIDVEGAELDVVAGARSWMDASNLFVIEVHEEGFLEQLKVVFAEHGHRLTRVNQRPLPVLGREERDEKNWWLVSRLG